MRVNENVIEKHLIRAGWIILFLSLLGIIGSSALVGVALAAAAGCLSFGYYLHSRRRRAESLQALLRSGQQISRTEIAGALGISGEEVLRTLRFINRNTHSRRPMFLVWDPSSDQIHDRLAPPTQAIVVEHCAGCGALINETVRLDESAAPRCRFCDAIIASDRLEALRSDYQSSLQMPPEPEPPFRPWLFVLLLLVFWPAALAYAVWKSGLFDGWIEQIKAAAANKPLGPG